MALGVACYSGGPTDPDIHQASAPSVGPAPLRRMTGTEYLNALHDLFPAYSPVLPAIPEDLTVNGFDNNAGAQQPSDVLIARYEAIANLYAQAATATDSDVSALVGCSDWSTPALMASCGAAFITQTGRRLFRRPLTSAEEGRYFYYFQTWRRAVDFAGAVELTLSAMLQSPQFLYRPEPVPSNASQGTAVPLDPYELATRLSFFIWESVPDDALLAAADRGELATDDELRAEVDRMIADDRAQRVFWDFPRQWLGLDQILLVEGATRTSAVDPTWTTATQASASQETRLFIQNTLAQGGTFRDLLTSPRAWVDGEMSRIYGLPAPSVPTSWTEVLLPSTERAGLLTRVAYLAGYSHAGATSPPVRGNAIQLRLLCELPESPPPGADLSQPMSPPGSGPATNRTLYEERTAPAGCQVCHRSLNGFGFGLESYDAAGHYQTTDNGLPVDASGWILGTDVDAPFTGGVELSAALAQSRVVHDCATQEMVRFAFGRGPVDAELATWTTLSDAFVESGGDLRALVTSIVLSPSFRTRLVEDD